jgi:hypothetical protein
VGGEFLRKWSKVGIAGLPAAGKFKSGPLVESLIRRASVRLNKG